ncbi:hypothetical protein HZC09_07090 [Candidatus Micrarchaeota archaeon]|nr:hypothetical protein [Candidatus Micrarchaeota archaeon]
MRTIWRGFVERIRNPIVLEGGRKPVRAREIKRGALIGSGGEGSIYEVEVKVERRGKQRVLRMASKEFKEKNPFAYHENTGDPVKHYETLRALQKLNREKGNVLNLLPTIRLTNREGKSILIMTKLNLRSFNDLREEHRLPFYEDMTRQQEILEKEGYSTDATVFHAKWDDKEKRFRAYITDAGRIEKDG